MLTWKHRRHREETDVATHLVRQSVCGNFRVVHWLPSLESLAGPRWFSMYRAVCRPGVEVWRILGEHRKESTARAACERRARLAARGGCRRA